ncbi:tripartite tricarboxylate transporter substrate binding protein [Alcaligenaceae bacterium]|nr:tripartite tricarboxylate transporter substrate binding protein [Alcaligenaceae bacterium]
MNETTTTGCILRWLAGVATALLAGHAGGVWAADYPSRPLAIVVPAATGGPTDILARLVAEGMSRQLQQTVIVENTPGGGGTIALRRVARAEPDGHTLVLANVGMLAATPTLHNDLQYDALTDLVALASVADSPMVLSVKNDLPVANLAEFADYVRANAGKLNYGSAGVGSGTHLGGILVNTALGVDVQPIHYRGGGQAITDVMAGHIDYMIESATTAVASVGSKRVKGLAVLSESRMSTLPDVPSSAEAGFPDLNFDIWNMLLAPAATPPDRIETLSGALVALLSEPDFVDQLSQLGLILPPSAHRSAQGAADLLRDDTRKWRRILTDAGLAVN